jgi:PAS domain S-box-containing protein
VMPTEERAWLANQIVQESQDDITMADREGVIRLWNKGAQKIFGFTPAEALDQFLHIIIPENLRERHDQGYRQVMESGHSKYSQELLAVPAIKKDGSRKSVEFTLILIREQDRILGVAAIIRDVSTRWERDRTLQRRLAQLEALVQQHLNSKGS